MRQGKLLKVLTECIRNMESRGGSLGDRFNRRPEHTEDLQELLELWRNLDFCAKAVPAYAGQLRGQQKMLTALAEMGRKGGERKMIPALLAPAAAKAVAVVAAATLVTGGAAGASAARTSSPQSASPPRRRQRQTRSRLSTRTRLRRRMRVWTPPSGRWRTAWTLPATTRMTKRKTAWTRLTPPATARPTV